MRRKWISPVAGIAAYHIQQIARFSSRIKIEMGFVDINRQPHHPSCFFFHFVVCCKVKVAVCGGNAGQINCRFMAKITIHLKCPAVGVHNTVKPLFVDVLGQHFQVPEFVCWADGGGGCTQ